MIAAAGLAGPQGASAPFRLVDDFQAGYLKFQRREPRTLEELLLAREHYRHECRLRQIKTMAQKLALLEPFLPALAERGLKFSYRDIDPWDDPKTPGTILRILPASFTLHDDRLYSALIELGFREIARTSYSAKSDHEQVTLKHGRALLVRIDVTKKPAAPEGGAA